MSKPTIDFAPLSNEDVADLFDDVRDELDRRIAFMMERRDGRPKGPGRPRKNGYQAADRDEDATSI